MTASPNPQWDPKLVSSMLFSSDWKGESWTLDDRGDVTPAHFITALLEHCPSCSLDQKTTSVPDHGNFRHVKFSSIDEASEQARKHCVEQRDKMRGVAKSIFYDKDDLRASLYFLEAFALKEVIDTGIIVKSFDSRFRFEAAKNGWKSGYKKIDAALQVIVAIRTLRESSDMADFKEKRRTIQKYVRKLVDRESAEQKELYRSSANLALDVLRGYEKSSFKINFFGTEFFR